MPLSQRPGTWLDPRHPAPQLLLVAAVTLAGYGRSLTRYFVSEDFVILRHLSEESLLRTLWTELTGPWLGITLVRFYRPLSTLALKVEALVWGTWAPGYLAAHFAVHLLNATLLYLLVRKLVDDKRSMTSLTVTLLFSLYPLHPNAVLFIGSFATLFSTTACLASMLLFLGSRRAASLACFALALGCYEAAAVLPILLVTLDLLFAPGGRPLAWRPLLARHLPYAGILAVYFGLRYAVLGAAIGGYRGLQQHLAGFDLRALSAHLRIDLARLVYPAYDPGPPPWAAAVAALAVAAGTLACLARPRAGGGAARLWLLGVAWTFAAQLPFGVVDVVPAVGRYWYLSSAGAGLLIASAAVAAAPDRWRDRVLAIVALAVGASYLGLLSRATDRHLEAGVAARAVQAELLRAGAGDARIFVADHPDFVYTGGRKPVAQVFHWGLADALMPPFVDREARVYPLPRFSPAELTPILDRPDLGPVWRWDAASGTLRRLGEDAAVERPRIAVRELGPGETTIRFEPTGAQRYRLVLLARGHPSFAAVGAEAGPDGLIEAPLPAEFLASMERLYGSEVFWWLEAEDAAGKPTAFSEIRTLASPAGGWSGSIPAPDVVLITVDTLRADRLGCYGADTYTPNVDRLAAEGMLFEHAASPMPETRPAHVSLFTSRYPRDHGVLSNAAPYVAGAPTLPEVYAEAGYLSAGFAGCALFDAAAGSALGFTEFDPPETPQRAADEVVPAAIEWLRSVDPDRRVFLWLHLFDPHMPYQPPPPFDRGDSELAESWPAFRWPDLLKAADRNGGALPRPVFERALELYDGEVEYVDHWLGRFFQALEEMGRWDGAVVALTADHGECFAKGVFFDHSQCLDDGAIAVPLIVRYPPRIAAGGRVAAQVELLDVAPTLLRLSGLPVPPEYLGRGLLARASASAASTPEPAADGALAFFEHPYYRGVDVEDRRRTLSRLRSVAGEPTREIVGDRLQVGARSGVFKYLRRGADETLYDLRRDPGELDDLAAEESARRDRFRLAVRRWMRDHPPRLGTETEIHPELRKNLEALGYL